MNVQAAKATRIPTTAVTSLIVDAMGKVGVSKDDAGKIAGLMLEADLIGADAHGVFRLMQYVQRLKLGSTNPRPNITVNRTGSLEVIPSGKIVSIANLQAGADASGRTKVRNLTDRRLRFHVRVEESTTELDQLLAVQVSADLDLMRGPVGRGGARQGLLVRGEPPPPRVALRVAQQVGADG